MTPGWAVLTMMGLLCSILLTFQLGRIHEQRLTMVLQSNVINMLEEQLDALLGKPKPKPSGSFHITVKTDELPPI